MKPIPRGGTEKYMEQEIQVSVILLTYEPKWEKLERTARSILRQTGIETEIVVGDDGSKNDLFPRLEALLRSGGARYTLHKCPRNVGTLRNALEALYRAKGEYVYLISPGDLLFDSRTLADFYQFAKGQDAPLLFGRAVYYNADETGVTVYRGKNLMPSRPDLYTPGGWKLARKVSFFLDSHILGAAFLRKREAAIRYMEQVKPCSRYVEDATSTACALMDGQEVRFFDRNVVWYEYGTGLSAPDSKWGKIVAGEITECFGMLKQAFPKDPVLDAAVFKRSGPSRKRQLIRMLLCHPVLLGVMLYTRGRKPALADCTAEEESLLQKFILETTEQTGGSHGNQTV